MRALADLDRDAGDIERTLADLYAGCLYFLANVRGRAAFVDPYNERHWTDLALGFLLGAGCELPEEDDADGKPVGYTTGVMELLAVLANGLDVFTHADLDARVIAVVGALFTPERVAEVIA